MSNTVKNNIRHNFVHLSANFNKPAFPLPKVVDALGNVRFYAGEVDFVNKIAYVNHPRITDNINKPYAREILSE